MKILYIAKHTPCDNEDEIAIAYALEQLGHEVLRIQEFNGHNALAHRADFCLFHKYDNYEVIEAVSKRVPTICWFFDKVKFDEPKLAARSELRVNWMEQITKFCHTIFCTDGDWVDQDESGKLCWLMQGADERYVGFGEPNQQVAPILFTGTPRHGQQREDHIAHLQERWGDRFQVLGAGGNKSRKHGRELANIIASSKIIIAPDGPSTDRYWSNRVYLISGFGGLLLHPHCSNLRHHYSSKEVLMYADRDHLDDMIEIFLDMDNSKLQEIRVNAYERTLKDNLYRHRCEQLVNTFKERSKW